MTEPPKSNSYYYDPSQGKDFSNANLQDQINAALWPQRSVFWQAFLGPSIRDTYRSRIAHDKRILSGKLSRALNRGPILDYVEQVLFPVFKKEIEEYLPVRRPQKDPNWQFLSDDEQYEIVREQKMLYLNSPKTFDRAIYYYATEGRLRRAIDVVASEFKISDVWILDGLLNIMLVWILKPDTQSGTFDPTWLMPRDAFFSLEDDQAQSNYLNSIVSILVEHIYEIGAGKVTSNKVLATRELNAIYWSLLNSHSFADLNSPFCAIPQEVIEFPPWNPFDETRATYTDRMVAQTKRAISMHCDNIESILYAAGFKNSNRKRSASRHFQWLVAFHVDNLSLDDIAEVFSLNDTNGITDAIKEVAESIDFTLRPSRGGSVKNSKN